MDEMTLKEAYDCKYGGKDCSGCKYRNELLQVCYASAEKTIAEAVKDMLVDVIASAIVKAKEKEGE